MNKCLILIKMKKNNKSLLFEINKFCLYIFFFSLQSIIIHQGNINVGHYFVYIKDFYLNQWNKFNSDTIE